MNRRFEITDDEWEQLRGLLPATTPRRGGRWRGPPSGPQRHPVSGAAACPGGTCRSANQATVCVADIFIWLRARPDQPRRDPANTL
jgi:hypothetical protein